MIKISTLIFFAMIAVLVAFFPHIRFPVLYVLSAVLIHFTSDRLLRNVEIG